MSKELSWTGIEQFGGRLVTLAVGMVLARLLEPAAFGLIASVSVFMTVFQQLVDGGISQRVIQKTNVGDEEYSALFWGGLFVCLLVVLILVVCSDLIAQFFGQPELSLLVKAMAGVMLLMNMGRVQLTVLNRELRFKELAIIRMVAVCGGAVGGIWLALVGGGVWALVLQQAMTAVLMAVIAWTRVPWRPRKFVTLSAIKDLYGYGLPILISQSIRSLANQLPNVVIARTHSPQALGYYDRGRLIPHNMTTAISSVFSRINFPALSRLQEDPALMRRQFFRISGIALGITTLTMVALGVYAEEAVTILLGEKWRPGIWYAQAACVLAVIHVFYLLNADLLRALGKTQTFFKINMLCAGLQITLILSAIPLGIRWVIIADIVARFIALFFLIGSVGRISEVQPMEQLKKFGTAALWGLFLMVILFGARWLAPGIVTRLFFGFVVVLGFGCLWSWKYRTELRELIILRN